MSDLVAIGYYRAVAVPVTIDGETLWAQLGRSKEKQTPQVSIMFAILDEGPYKGRRIGWMGFFTEASVDRTVESLRLCGFKGDELADLPRQALDQEVSVTVEHDEWEGKKRAKVAWVNAPGGGMKMANPMDAKDIRIFSAKMKAKFKAKPEVAGEKANAPAPSAPASPEADDIAPPVHGGFTPPQDDDGIPF
jgi:hypothetical protein